MRASTWGEFTICFKSSIYVVAGSGIIQVKEKKVFDEGCLLIGWVLDWCYLYSIFHFQKFVLRALVGSRFGYKFGIFRKCSTRIFGNDFGQLWMHPERK